MKRAADATRRRVEAAAWSVVRLCIESLAVLDAERAFTGTSLLFVTTGLRAECAAAQIERPP
jgi:hypothetical protein